MSLTNLCLELQSLINSPNPFAIIEIFLDHYKNNVDSTKYKLDYVIELQKLNIHPKIIDLFLFSLPYYAGQEVTENDINLIFEQFDQIFSYETPICYIYNFSYLFYLITVCVCKNQDIFEKIATSDQRIIMFAKINPNIILRYYNCSVIISLTDVIYKNYKYYYPKNKFNIKIEYPDELIINQKLYYCLCRWDPTIVLNSNIRLISTDLGADLAANLAETSQIITEAILNPHADVDFSKSSTICEYYPDFWLYLNLKHRLFRKALGSNFIETLLPALASPENVYYMTSMPMHARLVLLDFYRNDKTIRSKILEKNTIMVHGDVEQIDLCIINVFIDKVIKNTLSKGHLLSAYAVHVFGKLTTGPQYNLLKIICQNKNTYELESWGHFVLSVIFNYNYFKKNTVPMTRKEVDLLKTVCSIAWPGLLPDQNPTKACILVKNVEIMQESDVGQLNNIIYYTETEMAKKIESGEIYIFERVEHCNKVPDVITLHSKVFNTCQKLNKINIIKALTSAAAQELFRQPRGFKLNLIY
jgi:hypothetical protein